MTLTRDLTALLFCAVVVSAGCGDQGPAAKVPGNAHFVNGATSLTEGTPEDPAAGMDAETNGRSDIWTVSPTRVRVRLTSVTFERTSHWNPATSPLTDCEVLYDRAAPSLSTRLNCPFTVDTGTYVAVRLGVSPTYQVFIDDALNAWFTDPGSATGFSSVRPSSGPAFVTATSTFGPDAVLYLGSPLVITQAQPVELTVVLHGLHTMSMERVDGVPRMRSTNLFPLYLIPSLSGVATTEFYSSAGTANSMGVSGQTKSATMPMEFAVFYDVGGPTTLFFVNGLGGTGGCAPHPPEGVKPGKGSVQNTSPDVSPLGSDGNKAGGFLGRDASGTLAWALGANADYSEYLSIWSMPQATAPGQPVTLKCFRTSTAPKPISGVTYASGAPPIPNPTLTYRMTSVAR